MLGAQAPFTQEVWKVEQVLSPFWVAFAHKNIANVTTFLWAVGTLSVIFIAVVGWINLMLSHYRKKGFRWHVARVVLGTNVATVAIIYSHLIAVIVWGVSFLWLMCSFILSLRYDQWTPAWGLVSSDRDTIREYR